jgi:hypothetical protein
MKKPLKSKSSKTKRARKPRATQKKKVTKKTRKPRETRQKKIKKIINTIQCSKDFKCYESKFKELCKAKDIGLKSFLLCLEETRDCNFSIYFIDEYLCKCPLRVFVAKELKK